MQPVYRNQVRPTANKLTSLGEILHFPSWYYVLSSFFCEKNGCLARTNVRAKEKNQTHKTGILKEICVHPAVGQNSPAVSWTPNTRICCAVSE